MSKKRFNDSSTIFEAKKRRCLSELNKENSQSVALADASVRCGKIMRIHLTNFMCHSNLKIDLCSRVNFLIGANGSGKSAILTALVVGLGAKARNTNRSTSIKQLVKTGENAADIEITIANSGDEAYEPQVYGEFITIVRHILASGSSSYKIKNQFGNIISKKLDDLHKILLYHNIQTDNPVFVLNQDSARTFLREMDPSKNYILFLKATQIEVILEKLNQCGIMYQDYRYRLSCYEKQLELMEKELNDLREKEERLASADDIKRKVKQFKLEATWLKVQQQEEVVDEVHTKSTVVQNKYQKIKKSLDERDSAEKAIEHKIKEYEKQYLEKSNSFQSKITILENLKSACKEATQKLEQKSFECKKLRSKISDYKNQILSYEERIEERTGNGLTQVQKLRMENEHQLENLSKEKDSYEIFIQQQKRELDLLNETKLKQEYDFEDLKRQRAKVSDKIINSERELSKIQSTSNNKFSVYGPQMSAFVEEIRRNKNKFSELPIGPLGLYISVSEQKWRGPIELLIGGLLTSFVVNNESDSRLLSILKNKYETIRSPIITMRFPNHVYDVSSGACIPPQDTILVMNEIKCDNPVVMNCLIDRGKIETILLTENQTLAINLTAYEENVPRNLLKVILLNPFLEYCPAPKYRAYSLTERPPRYLQVNMEEIRKNLQIELDKQKGIKAAYEEKLRCLKSKLTEIYRHVKINSDKLAENQRKMNVTVEKIQELESYEYPEEIQIEFFKKEISELQKTISIQEETLVSIEEGIKILLQNKIEKTEEFDNYKATINSDEEQVKELKINIDELKSQLYSIANNANSWQSSLKKLEKEISENDNKLTVERQKLESLIETASLVGERIIVTKSEDELKTLIKKNEYSLKQILTTDENLSDVKALIENKQFRYEKFQAFTETIARILEMLKKTRIQRFKFIMNLKNHMAIRVKFTFIAILDLKNFTGNIDFNHKDQKLELTIVPRDKHIDNAVCNTKSLSGGERSFSTVALLLSLWSCVDHPFYFLDEYDVFTDQVNREIMTKLLLSEAEKKPHRQYTFLTPQDVSFVKASNTVVIQKLAEPKR
ncbi:structural maintenance of chromosomes protein 6 isoform X2 [Condylostylus longicornis]|uniref:structural maintenance of chromosomes protein 6 isoform X2 n=1 Tax=Condylostylus longicornis TaxID=2530218 RepID=UPI00244E2B1B|nr:structural maintenance of chromosomes protein 6 isoform X2 [Condylostylus longicornis]